MKKMNSLLQLIGYLFIFFIIASFFILISAATGCSSPNMNTDKKEPVSIEHIPSVYTVVIAQMSFSPSEITVEKGDTVIFINHDLVVHDITEASAKIWTSSPLQPEQKWKLEVNETANYFCSLHPIMKGIINVK